MIRYIKRLEREKDLSLTHSYDFAGSCTVKLNAASELLPLSRPEFGGVRPLHPLFTNSRLSAVNRQSWKRIKMPTGFAACSLQPNSVQPANLPDLWPSNSSAKQTVSHSAMWCLFGTRHQSGFGRRQAGMDIVVVECDDNGNTDIVSWNKSRSVPRNPARLLI